MLEFPRPLRSEMTTTPQSLWHLTQSRIEIDPADLASAIEFEAAQQPLDFRTRLLIRDSLVALTKYWGEDRVTEWLAQSVQQQVIESIRLSDLGPVGFPS